jgi:integrase
MLWHKASTDLDAPVADAKSQANTVPTRPPSTRLEGMILRRSAARAPGLASGLALAVRPAGLAEAPGSRVCPKGRAVGAPFDVRCARYGVRRITLHDTRRTCGSLLVALDVHPRIAMAILRHSRIALTMEIYTRVPDKVTRDALRRLSDWLDHDEDQGDDGRR